MAKKPKYQLFDKLRTEEYEALKADIEKRGVLVPVEKDENGDILDGHNRAEIADELGKTYKTIVRRFKSEAEKREHVIKLNLARRHLEPWQWGLAFKQLLAVRGVKLGRGMNQGKHSDTVSECASECGADERTARRRVRQADAYDALSAAAQKDVREKRLTLAQATRAKQRKAKQEELVVKAQAIKKTDKAEQAWNLICGDCLAHLPKLSKVRLVFADPPYNVGIDYGDGKKADLLPADDYLRWCAQWIAAAVHTLTDDGSLWVMIGDEWAEHYAVMLNEAGLHRRAWIKWYETFGNNCANNFNRCSRHIFYYVVNPKRFVFNADAVNRPSDRQVKYKDKRADPAGKTWDDVWQIPRLTDSASERLPDFPTQVPLAITRAIVGCASEPGDLVVDPFCGSASLGHAAIESGRRFIGIEKRSPFCEAAKLRLQAIGT